MPSLPVRIQHLPYVPLLDERSVEAIDLVVIHCTELPDLATARAYGERVLYDASGTGNSGHWYIDRDGDVVEYVPATRVAHHVRGHNPRSVGIELVNTGRWPHWLDAGHQAMDEPYPEAQVDALLALLDALKASLPSL
ncbi:MAG TPA: N-acetylmuramoyl-L-alanine amidase, partial [Luteimonas sp.]|nr:N-acetylmuramoyl-L-alanine amidase [Luteimonas sp.]